MLAQDPSVFGLSTEWTEFFAAYGIGSLIGLLIGLVLITVSARRSERRLAEARRARARELEAAEERLARLADFIADYRKDLSS